MSKEAYFRKRVQRLTLGDDVFYVRPMTGDQLSVFLREQGDDDLDGVEALARVCCFCACEENGERIWTDAEVSHARSVDIDILRAVAEKALEVSGLGDDDAKKD